MKDNEFYLGFTPESVDNSRFTDIATTTLSLVNYSLVSDEGISLKGSVYLKEQTLGLVNSAKKVLSIILRRQEI